MNRIAAVLDSLAEWTGRALAWLTLAMVLATFAVVVLRYAFGLGWVAMQESVLWMHGLVFMLGAAYTLKHDAHVRVDVFYRRLGLRGRAWVDLAGTLLLLMPVCALILISAWDYVGDAWAIRERSREAGGLPGLYLLKTAIPLAAVLLALQGVAMLMRSWQAIVSRPEGRSHEGHSHGAGS